MSIDSLHNNLKVMTKAVDIGLLMKATKSSNHKIIYLSNLKCSCTIYLGLNKNSKNNRLLLNT